MKNLTEGNIYKTFLLFSIPMVLTALLSQGYNLVDTVIAGKFIGSKGLAAIGSTSAFISVISSVFWGYGNGFSIYIARLFGAKEYSKLKQVIYINYALFITVMVTISVIIVIFRNEILTLLKVDKSIMKESLDYFVIYMLGLFLIQLNYHGLYIMNALGISTFPFYMSVIAALLNIMGNIYSVVILKMGVSGLAISSCLSALIVDIFYVAKLKRCFKVFGVDKEKVKFALSIIKPTVSYAIPTSFQQTTMYIASLVVSPIVNGIGSQATAAYTVVMKIYNINAGVYQNSAKTVSNYIAQCMGAKKYDKIKKGIHVGMIQGILYLLPFVLVCSLLASPVCKLFFPKGHTGLDLEYAITFSMMYLPFILINLINNLFHSMLRGVKAMDILVKSTFIGTIARILFSYILAKKYGMHGVYLGWVISWAAEAIYAFYIYFSSKWKRNIYI